MTHSGLQKLREFVEKMRLSGAPAPIQTELETIAELIEQGFQWHESKTREMLEQLSQVSRLAELGTMAAALLHEMNQPMLGIKGFVELILENLTTKKPEKIEEWAREIHKQVLRIQDLQANMANFLRKEETPAPAVDLRAVLDETLKIFDFRLQKKRIQLSIDLPVNLPKVTIARRHLSQILVNLIGNSIDALDGRPQATIEISGVLQESDHFLHLFIADNGSGISQDTRDRIFEPFFSTKGNQGTGLGLYIARTLASVNGGALELHTPVGPPSPGEFATVFELRLPWEAGDEHELIIDVPEPPRMPSDQAMARIRLFNDALRQAAENLVVCRRVLIVDDEPVIRRVLIEYLSSLGITTQEACNADEAQALLAQDEFAVVMTDKNLPGMDGIELLRAVKTRWPQIEVLMITGYASVDSALSAIGEGAFDYIAKPFPSLTLVGDKVRAALARFDYEARMQASVNLLTQHSKSLLAELDSAEKVACITRLRDVLSSYNQDEFQAGILVVGPESLVPAVVNLGFQATRVASLEIALKTIQENEFQVVVFVEAEEGPTGSQAVRRIQAVNPNIGVFVIARSRDIHEIMDAIGAGVGDYLTQPVEAKTFFAPRLLRLVARLKHLTRYTRLISALKDLNLDLIESQSACSQPQR